MTTAAVPLPVLHPLRERSSAPSVRSYLVWRPLGHIDWQLARAAHGGGAAEGARFRIVEAFGARPEYRYDGTERTKKLDETGIRLVQRIAGAMIFQLEHTWSPRMEGTHVSVMDTGARSTALAPIEHLCPVTHAADISDTSATREAVR